VRGAPAARVGWFTQGGRVVCEAGACSWLRIASRRGGTPRLRGLEAAGCAKGAFLIARRLGLPNKALQLTAGGRGMQPGLPAAAGSGAGRAVGGRTMVRWGTAGGS
jgi:hypothetical protein